VYSRGYATDVLDGYEEVALDAAAPIAEAVRIGFAVFVPTAADLVERYPAVGVVAKKTGSQAVAAIPISAEGEKIGALGISFGEPHAFPAEEREFLDTLGRLVGHAFARARLYETAREAMERAERALEVRERFLRIATHELQTPLASAYGFAQLAQRAAAHDGVSKDVSCLVTRVVERIARMSRLVGQLLDATRLEQGRTLPVEVLPTDVAAIVRAVVEPMRMCTTRHSWRLDVPPSVIVAADPLRIEQLVTNLVDNAVRYSPEGGDIAVELRAGDGIARMSVTDDGVGIGDEDTERIFDRFYELGNPRVVGGLGLGLFIAREIVSAHGGRIWAERRPRGTRFVVELPLAATGVETA
jgi:signal transduction histidine kinase